MQTYVVVTNVLTTVVFAAFIGIVWWAWSSRQKKRFDEAAHAPFALPDELEQAMEKEQ